DMYGDIETVGFPRSVANCRDIFVSDKIVIIEGVLNVGDNGASINVRNVREWTLDNSAAQKEDAEVKDIEDLYIKVPDRETYESKVKQALADRPGESRVIMQLDGKLYDTGYRVNIKPGLIYELSYTLGEKCIKRQLRKK
ncbi:MAG: hypothetical protein K2I79_03025, partial [Clostridia bacterium]|nr:hypothetical protein [Clostridia bacterium]